MRNSVYCSALPSSGVRHRFAVLRDVLHFANRFGYRTHFYWGITRGVGACRFEELFAPIPGVHIDNIPDDSARELDQNVVRSGLLCPQDRVVPLFQPQGKLPSGSFFSYEFQSAGALNRLTGAPTPNLTVQPSQQIQVKANATIAAHRIHQRLGIRVRVSESRVDDRKPHRSILELDEVVSWLKRIPRRYPVFVATDSLYVQDALRRYFTDIVSLQKRFDSYEPSGRYVGRQDRGAMLTFIEEVYCLCACRQIINLGGFLNEGSVKHKFIPIPRQLSRR